MGALDDYRLGEHGEPLRLAGVEENRTAAATLAAQAGRSLHLFTWDLDPNLYDQPDFLDAVRTLAVRGLRPRVEVLVQDSRRAVMDGHRLIELSRRLSSFVELRKVHPDYRDHIETFLVVDARGLLLRKQADTWEGEVNFNAPAECTQLLKFFREVWEKSEPDPEMRRLHA